MAAQGSMATLVPGETVEHFKAKFRRLIDQETDPAKRAELEAQLAEKEAAIMAKTYWPETLSRRLPARMCPSAPYGNAGTGLQVRIVRKVTTGEVLAMKIMKKEAMVLKNQIGHIKAERDAMVDVLDRFVVNLHYSFQDDDHLYLVMDYLPGGDLMGLLIKEDVFPEEATKFYAAQAIQAIGAIHALGYIHRDLKPVGGKGAPKKPGAFGIGGPAAVDIQYLQRPVAGGQVDWSGKGPTPSPAPAPAAGRGEAGLPPSSYGRADPARGGRPSTQSHASAEDASEGKSAGGEGRRGSGQSGAPRRSRGGRGGGRAAAPRPEWVDVTDTTPEEGSPSAPSSPAAAAGGEGGPESPSRADLEQLARTMRAEAAEDGLAFDDGEFVNINLCLDRVVEQEEALLASHMSSIQRHAEFLTEEGGLLSKCSGPDVVDYDIDAYTASLESILQNKLKDTKALLKKS
ncbi:CBK1 [Symbiodinium sp. KB8]|nr:CBK1 [Symbiodinium sp. KB8]